MRAVAAWRAPYTPRGAVAKDRQHRREALETRIKAVEERVFRLEERVSVQLRSFREGLAAASEDAQRDRIALQVRACRVNRCHVCALCHPFGLRGARRSCKGGWRKT